MNKFIKENYNKIFLIFLYMQPILDMFIGIGINYLKVDVVFGTIFRMIFMLFTIYSGIFVYKERLKQKIIYLILILIYIIIYIANLIIFKDINVVIYEIQNLFKVLYLPCILICISKINIENKHLLRIFTIYSLAIIIPTILGINFDAYTQGKVGTSGLFNSANEISAIMTILMPVLIIFILNKDWKNKIYLINLIPIFMIGSKISILALIFVILIIAIYYLAKYYKKKTEDKNKFKNKNVIIRNIVICVIILLMLVAILIIVVPKTSFYKNIIIHLEFLEINEFSDVFTYEFLNRFIFSDRLDFLLNTTNSYLEASWVEKFFGIGYIENYGELNESAKLIEMDIFDIFYRLGIIGFILVMYPIISKIKDVMKQKNGKIQIEFILSGILILVLSMFVGHTMVAPAVSVYIIIILLKADNSTSRIEDVKEVENENRICNSKL